MMLGRLIRESMRQDLAMNNTWVVRQGGFHRVQTDLMVGEI